MAYLRLDPAELQLVPRVEVYGDLVVRVERVPTHQREEVIASEAIQVDRPERMRQLVCNLVEGRQGPSTRNVHGQHGRLWGIAEHLDHGVVVAISRLRRRTRYVIVLEDDDA